MSPGRELAEELLGREVEPELTADWLSGMELLRAVGARGLTIRMWRWEIGLVDDVADRCVCSARGGVGEGGWWSGDDWDVLVVLASLAATDPPPQLLACATFLLAAGTVEVVGALGAEEGSFRG